MRWYVLRSKPNKEEALCREVGRRGHEVFYPSIRIRPVNPRAHKSKPYFPGYIFVHMNHLLVNKALFSWVPYAQGLVIFGDEPAEVPDAMIAAIGERVSEINAVQGEGFDKWGVKLPTSSQATRSLSRTARSTVTRQSSTRTSRVPTGCVFCCNFSNHGRWQSRCQRNRSNQ